MTGAYGIIGVIYYIILLAEFPGVVELCESGKCAACDGNYEITRLATTWKCC